MNLLSPLYFQIPELRNLQGKYQEVLQEQDNFLEALGNSEKFPGLILSLRYLFDPEAEPREKLKIYLGINHAEGNDKIVKEAGNFLTKGSLGDYYRFKLLPTPPQLFQKLTWVEEICEVIKYEEFDQKQDFYVPYLFAPNPKNDMFSVCKRLNRVDAKMAIEVTLQTCDGWAKKKISDILAAVLREINPSDHRLQTNPVGNAVRDNYDDYNRGYLQNKRNLFKYNIKILAESGDDISLVISDLARKALGNGKYGIRYREIQLKKGDANFEESLRASERVELSIAAKWEGWETEIAEKRIENLSSASSGISFPIMLEKDGPINEENNLLSSKGEMVKSSDSAISKFLDDLPKKNRAIAKIADLQPLARMVTPTEISGFFRIVVAGEKGVPGMALEKPRHKIVKDEDIFQKYKDKITEDRYIVGLTDDGTPVYSSWAEIPHRLIAGLPGAGKSNFLNWIIFQFLYANPKGKIYITDLSGVDFQHLEELKVNVEIAKDMEECKELVEKIHKEEYQKRQKLMQKHKVNNLPKLQSKLREENSRIYRTLWIIDEASDIADADRELQRIVEKRLSEYARKGRKLGLHVIYCTQFPSSEVVNRQVRVNCEEKIVFRLSADASETVLDQKLGVELALAPTGKAFLHSSKTAGYVNTPYIPIPDEVPVEKTIWRYV